MKYRKRALQNGVHNGETVGLAIMHPISAPCTLPATSYKLQATRYTLHAVHYCSLLFVTRTTVDALLVPPQLRVKLVL
jgi:hypothetical protein